MNYPLISEYKEAIKSAEDNFNELSNLRPVLDEDGEPVMTSGNFAVVFKMRDEQTGKLHAVKCFLKEQEGRAEAYRMIAEELEYVSSTFLTPIKYLDKELFVDSKNSDETEFPVLLMDWVEGMTLDKYIQKYVYNYQRAENLDETPESEEKAVELLVNGYELEKIAYQFSCLAIWLLQQPFAHGDLKPDNIIVKEDGRLALVDYDGMYVPAMKGQKARELGSPDFRHPLRNENDFDDHIDDFPLSSILLSLLAIANEPSLFEKYGGDGRLLLSERDYRNIAESEVLGALRPLMADKNLTTYLSLFYLCSAQKSLFKESYHLFTLPEPEKPSFMLEEENLSTEVTEEDLANAWTDENGVKYSKDRKRLLNAPTNLSDYIIKNGTKVICESAFEGCEKLKTLMIPNSAIIIGTSAFADCNNLAILKLPQIREIPSGVFGNCASLQSLVIPDGVTYIGIGAFYGCEKLESISIPQSVTEIGQGAFEKCRKLPSISIPEGVEFIDDLVFSGCSSLKSILLPQTVKLLGNEAFYGCESLTYILFPNNIETIAANCFAECKKLTSVDLPNSLSFIGENAFYNCCSLRRIKIPDSVEEIQESSFKGCEKLHTITFGNSIVKIGKHAFEGCCRLSSVYLPDSVVEIDDYAFCRCSISSIRMSQKLEKIGNHSFENAIEIGTINLPPSLREIGDYAFAWCKNLVAMNFPKTVNKIGEWAFLSYSSLKIVTLNSKTISVAQSSFDDFEHTHDIRYIGVPIGSRKYFEKKLPAYSSKLIELDESKGTFVTEEDVENAWIDEYGVKYSRDKKKLLQAPKDIAEYSIIEGTLIICEDAFSWNDNLRQVRIPQTVTTIGDYSFSMCRNLSVINFPHSIIFIGKKAFWWSYLKQVTIPNSVVEIGDEAFSYCLSLTQVSIPSSVTNIGRNAFYESTNLEEIIVPTGQWDDFADMLPNNKRQLKKQE